jgi:alkaline phosphatase D
VGDALGPADPTRRRLLIGGAALAAGLAVGCSSDDSSSPTTTSLSDGPPDTRTPPDLASTPFTLGVASGDPRPDSVVLWTRLAPDPLAADGLGGMPDEPVDVAWVVRARGTSNVLSEGVATAIREHGHTVHVVVNDLRAATAYDYAFTVGSFTSATGTFATLPDGSPERFSLAVVNCQWFETGAYAAYRHLVDEPVDLVLHLGDYIYEYAGATEGPRTTVPDHALETLADYRLRYASYRLDPDLQAAHARFPFVVTWDDHEVANNYMGDVIGDLDPGAATARKAAAYQAWWEHLPVRFDPPDGSELAVYQAFDVGDLARVYVLDQRQYSDVPPCRDDPGAQGDFGDCAARTDDADRTRLGAEQEAWFADQTAASRATWNLVGNPVVLAGVDGGNDADGSKYYLDTWDGFPTARHRFIEQLATMDNPVVLTGDYHAGMVLDVHERPFDGDGGAVVATELMSPAISSPLFPDDVSARTPQLRQQLNEHGYLTVAVEPERLTAQFRVLADVADPESTISTAATWVIQAGNPRAEPA